MTSISWGTTFVRLVMVDLLDSSRRMLLFRRYPSAKASARKPRGGKLLFFNTDSYSTGCNNTEMAWKFSFISSNSIGHNFSFLDCGQTREPQQNNTVRNQAILPKNQFTKIFVGCQQY